jgi:hypothetical protein
MSGLNAQIEMARKHVAEGRRIVTAQRRRIANGELRGTAALELLATFEQSLEVFEQDLAQLLSKHEK